ncbi:NADH dehydrogenase subunit 5 [Bacillus sp. BRMEA1]|uniref:NADH dehydrogenase subunit 5 n=1 Tax=Neobacillus endophyticus TaxID=2738405 RepID=UPI0015646B54|nr:NADH dehydrogenase subunit 5 [Neobacillus endophyticus]NRD76228.1 NADH dehydrogenase subunit 5 [Neobacillus endophyticus]
MLNFHSSAFLPGMFFILLAISVLSSLFLLISKGSLKWISFHIGVISFPPIAALAGLLLNRRSTHVGPWHFDSLSWLLALFVLTIGAIVQRYSVRYLYGDQSYRKYFSFLTLTTAADSLAWLSDDLRLLMLCWGATLLGLTFLIGLKQEWYVARNASVYSGRMFALSWGVLLLAVIWLTQATGHWQLSQVLTENSLSRLDAWKRTCINLLLILAVIIPAAQWPFHRWLLDSVVAPTPISAVMHAGIVNAGGILLTRFSPILSGDPAQMVLLIISSISVLMGTGIMLVQVDYKRQLVGSTMAQMGFMLIQCALGAYGAAVIHAVLHGLFKATLFLQAGSAVHQKERNKGHQKSSPLWTIIGGIIGLLTGIGYCLTSPSDGYQWISAIILGWAVSFAWMRMVAFGYGLIDRIAGMILLAGFAGVFAMIHTVLFHLLQDTAQSSVQTFSPAVIYLFIILIAGSVIGTWLFRHRSTAAFAVLYLWLIRLSEPQTDMVESHPKYLTHSMSQGGNLQ